MLSPAEKKEYRKRSQDPNHAQDTLAYLIERWCEDFDNPTQGRNELVDAVYEKYDILMTPDVVYKYQRQAQRGGRANPSLRLATAIFSTILRGD